MKAGTLVASPAQSRADPRDHLGALADAQRRLLEASHDLRTLARERARRIQTAARLLDAADARGLSATHLLAEQNSTPPGALTKAQLADALGVSTRYLDNQLRDPAWVAATGAYKTSQNRNGHWRFPLDAPERHRLYHAAPTTTHEAL